MDKYFLKTIIATLLFSGYTSVSAQHAGATDGYQLVWQDEFNGSALNTSVWGVGNDGNGGGNQELEYYLPQNVSVGVEPMSGENCLILTAKLENYSGHVCTSGKVNTSGRMSFRYGKLEARIKLPKTGNGLWPAFWLMGISGGWPGCGEIDVMEMGSKNGITAGTQEKYFGGALHFGQGTDLGGGSSRAWFYSLQDTFHLYTLIWDANTISMYIDLDAYPNDNPANPDNPAYFMRTITENSSTTNVGYYFHNPFYVILNLAIGGTYTGITGNSNIDQITAFSKAPDGEPKMYIDYVRVYQLGNPDEVYNGPPLTDIRVPTPESLKIGTDPVTGDIQVDAAEIPKSIALYDMMGQKIMKVYKTGRIYTSSLPKGCYIAKIETSAGEVESCKFIKK